MKLVFLKDVNIENSISFVRDQQLLNITIPAIEDPSVSGSDYFLSLSSQTETEYLQMRRDIPNVFDSISGFFEEIETEKVCYLAFPGEDPNSSDVVKCNTMVNGLMKQGLTFAIDLLIRYFN